MGLAQYYEEPEFPFYGLGFLIMLHMFYIMWHVLASLTYEGKTQIWLHNPNSMILLLGSKIVIACFSVIFSLIFLLVFNFLSIQLYTNLLGLTIQDFFDITTSVFLTSVYLGLWAIFYWSLYYVLLRFLNKVITSIVVAVLVYVTTILHASFGNTLFYKTLLEMGPTPIKLYHSIIDFNQGIAHQLSFDSTSIGLITFYSLVAFILFFASVILLNKKVEV